MTTVKATTDRRTAAYIADHLARRISGGKLTPGERIESEQALCRRFGVCRATVTKALRRLQREGLLISEHGRGRFVADGAARKRTWTIGLIHTDLDYLTHPAVVASLGGVREAVRDSDYHVKIIAVNEARQKRDDWMNVVDPDSLDGAIVMTRMVRMQHLTALAERLPVVWMAGAAVADVISGVGPDTVGGAFDAVMHLLIRGHRRIALITIGAGYLQGRDQSVGARLALRAAVYDGSHLQTCIAKRNRAAEGKRITLDLLRADAPPTAILCGSDEFAVGAYEAVAELNLEVPRDVSIVTWNDVLPDKLPIPTTAIAVDSRAHAVAAATHLVDLIEQRAEPGVMIETPLKLQVRRSTAPPAKKA